MTSRFTSLFGPVHSPSRFQSPVSPRHKMYNILPRLQRQSLLNSPLRHNWSFSASRYPPCIPLFSLFSLFDPTRRTLFSVIHYYPATFCRFPGIFREEACTPHDAKLRVPVARARRLRTDVRPQLYHYGPRTPSWTVPVSSLFCLLPGYYSLPSSLAFFIPQ